MTLWEHLSNLSSLHPEDVAFVGIREERKVSYSDLWGVVSKTSRKLHSLGIQRVLVLGPNCEEVAFFYLSCLISGIDVCILGESYAEEELRKNLGTFRPELIVSTSPESFQLGDSEELDTPVRDIMDLLPSGSQESEVIDLTGFRYGRQVVATSGSTGEPKMLAIGGNSLWSSALSFCGLYKLNSENIFWNFLPMSYLGGTFNLLLIPLAAGGRVLIDRGFGAQTIMRFFTTVNRFEVNTIWLIPTVIRSLKRLIGDSTSDLNLVRQKISFIGTAASLAEERRWIETILGCAVYENYGLTETTFVLAEPLRNFGAGSALGMQPYPGVKLDLTDPDKPLRVRTPFLFDGYLVAGHLDEPTVFEGWFDTQDYFERHSEGFVHKGRSRDIVKKGGLLINLAEIENLMRSFIHWGEVAAIPVEDEFYGESYVLLYENDQAALDEPSLLAQLARHVAKAKLPKDIKGIPRIPRTRSGKVDKQAALRSYLGLSGDRSVSDR